MVSNWIVVSWLSKKGNWAMAHNWLIADRHVDKYRHEIFYNTHCVKSVQIWIFLWSIFSCNWTKQRKIRTRKTSYLDTFHAMTGKNTSRYVDTLTKLAHSWSNCKGTQSHNNLVRKRTLNQNWPLMIGLCS